MIEDKHGRKYPWLVFFTSGKDIQASDEKDPDRSAQTSEEEYEHNDQEGNDDENETSEEEEEEEEEEGQVLLPKFYSLCEEEYFCKDMSDIKHGQCWASPQGWLFIHNRESSLCFLLNPSTLQKVQLPFLELEHPIDPDEHKLLLSSSPTTDPDHDCIVMFASYNQHRLHFCKLNKSEDHYYHTWTLIDFNSKVGDSETLIDVAVFNSKFYGVTDQMNVMLIQTNSPTHEITLIKTENNLCICSPVGARCIGWLIPSPQDLFLVLIFVSYASQRPVDLKVYKMDFEKHKWNKVDSIDDLVFITSGRFGVSCQGSQEVELLKGGCVYITETVPGRIGCLNLKDGSISLHELCPTSRTPLPLCILPPI